MNGYQASKPAGVQAQTHPAPDGTRRSATTWAPRAPPLCVPGLSLPPVHVSSEVRPCPEPIMPPSAPLRFSITTAGAQQGLRSAGCIRCERPSPVPQGVFSRQSTGAGSPDARRAIVTRAGISGQIAQLPPYSRLGTPETKPRYRGSQDETRGTSDLVISSLPLWPDQVRTSAGADFRTWRTLQERYVFQEWRYN